MSLIDRVLRDVTRGADVCRHAFLGGLAPDADLMVSEWAAAHRVVSGEVSASPGKWSNELAPYLVEPMDCLSPTHPARDVTFKKSAQIGGTECGLNWFGLIASEAPGPMGIWLPTVEMAKAYVRTKLQPTIESTPALRKKVSEQKSRDERGSTTMFKKFPGGFALISGANSSAGLQMFSLKYLIKEELSEWPWDVEGRGDPDGLVDARTKSFDRDAKRFNISTPGLKGQCRISAKYQASDQRKWYMPCPHCGIYQVLMWDNLKHEEQSPYNAHYACAGCGVLIAHHYKKGMIAKGVWLKCYEGEDCPPLCVAPEEVAQYRARSSGGREPGFWINQLSSPFVHWDSTVAEWMNAKKDDAKKKVFWQQSLGEEWEESGEAPDQEKLVSLVETYALRTLPKEALFITAAADVQANRIEYGVYGWGVGLSRWLIDKGVIEGDPAEEEVWRKLDEVVDRRYEDAKGRIWPIDLFGVDTGYLSHRVYSWVRRHAASGKVFALDGRAGWRLPPLGTPSKRDIAFDGRKAGTVMLWPVGTWDLKSELYNALRKTLAGRDEDGLWKLGAAHFPAVCDVDFFKQLTAEYLNETPNKAGYVIKHWIKRKGQPNEAHDIAVYAAALAHHLSDSLSGDDWQNLIAKRSAAPESAQLDLSHLWGATLKEHIAAQNPDASIAEDVAPTPAVPASQVTQSEWIGRDTSGWLDDRGSNFLRKN